ESLPTRLNVILNMNNFPDFFRTDNFQPRGHGFHDNGHVFFLRTSTHEDAVAWGFVLPVKSTVVFIKVQDPDEWESRRLLQNKGVDIDTFVKGGTIKKFCADNRSDVRIATMSNTGYFRIITVVWSPKGHTKDPVRDGDIM